MNACLEEIAKEKPPKEIDTGAALQETWEYLSSKSSSDAIVVCNLLVITVVGTSC